MTVQSNFEDILDSSISASTLPHEMKRCESAIRDLRHIVKFSDLPSRHELLLEYDNFVEGVRQATDDLISFNSKIGGAVDRVLSSNRWTLKLIAAASDRAQSRSLIQRVIVDPFSAPPSTEAVLLEQYKSHADTIQVKIQDLIQEALSLRTLLLFLDQRLDSIAEIVTRDGVHISHNRDELLSQLWTKLGGNRVQVQKFKKQMQALTDANRYRLAAYQRVEAVILQLQKMKASLEELRSRVSAPEMLGDSVPLEVQIEMIQLGVERLQEVRNEEVRGMLGQYKRVMKGDGEQIEGRKVIDAKLDGVH
jgi:hypothetical protein